MNFRQSGTISGVFNHSQPFSIRPAQANSMVQRDSISMVRRPRENRSALSRHMHSTVFGGNPPPHTRFRVHGPGRPPDAPGSRPWPYGCGRQPDVPCERGGRGTGGYSDRPGGLTRRERAGAGHGPVRPRAAGSRPYFLCPFTIHPEEDLSVATLGRLAVAFRVSTTTGTSSTTLS